MFGAFSAEEEARVAVLMQRMRAGNCQTILATAEPPKGSRLNLNPAYEAYQSCLDTRNELRYLDPNWESKLVSNDAFIRAAVSATFGKGEMRQGALPKIDTTRVVITPTAAEMSAISSASTIPTWAWVVGGLAIVGLGIYFGRR